VPDKIQPQLLNYFEAFILQRGLARDRLGQWPQAAVQQQKTAAVPNSRTGSKQSCCRASGASCSLHL
jgi:hypothetical protein